MKDSGIEWIGKTPEHWKIPIRFKFIIVKTNSGEVIDKGWWNTGDELLFTCQKTPMASNFDAFPLWKRTTGEDLLLTRNATPYVFMPPKNAIYSNVVQRVFFDVNQMNRKFLAYCLQCAADAYGEAMGASIPSYNMDIWGNFFIVRPSLREQETIVDYLDKKCEFIDNASNKLQIEIDELTQYQKSVIYEYVTGKTRL